MEFLENIIDDCFLVLHREHPDTEILCLVLLAELLTGKSEQRECDLITVLLMVMLCKFHCLIIEQ